MNKSNNNEVGNFLIELQHPLQKEIDKLRHLILSVDHHLSENIKWNGPNFMYKGEDRITMRVQPAKQIQLIFHRGAKVLALPKQKLISNTTHLLNWRSNDRAIMTFTSMKDIEVASSVLTDIVQAWIAASE